MQSLATAEADFHLDAAFDQVELQRNQGDAFFVHSFFEFFDFLFVGEQAPGPTGDVVEHSGMCVGGYLEIPKPEFAVSDFHVGVGEAEMMSLEGFYLAALKLDTAFQAVFDAVKKPHLAVIPK